MKTSHLVAAVVLVSLVAGPLVACSSTPTSESTGEYVDDAAISNKIRAQLIGEKDLTRISRMKAENVDFSSQF